MKNDRIFYNNGIITYHNHKIHTVLISLVGTVLQTVSFFQIGLGHLKNSDPILNEMGDSCI